MNALFHAPLLERNTAYCFFDCRLVSTKCCQFAVNSSQWHVYWICDLPSSGRKTFFQGLKDVLCMLVLFFVMTRRFIRVEIL